MKTKQEKALALLEALEQTDERLVQHAMHVDSPEQFVALGERTFLKRCGTIAACLALVAVLVACPWLLSQLPTYTSPPSPTKNMEVTAPTKPTVPTDPTRPADPTDPVDPTDPTVPIDPTVPPVPNVPEEYDPSEPPEMQVFNGSCSLLSYMTGYDWYCDRDWDNRVDISSPFINPLSAELQGKIPWGTTNESTLQLKCEKDIDSIHVRCWPESSLGNPDAYDAYETVTVINSDFTLKTGRYIYEVTAKWNNAYWGAGTVTYVFGMECSFVIIPPETDIQVSSGDMALNSFAGGRESGTRYDDVAKKWIPMSGTDGYWIMRSAVLGGNILPTITMAQDLQINLGSNGTLENILVYYKHDENTAGLYMHTQNPADLSALPPDTWCILVSVSWLGRYIEAEGKYETYNYDYVFTLEVPEPATPPYLWDFDEATGTLTVSGCEVLQDFSADGRWTAPLWINHRNDVKHVIVADGITRIGNYAFYGMPNLQTVTLPNGLKEIGDCAFMDAKSLVSISFPASLEKICVGSFQNCEKLPKINLPEGLQHIGTGAFQSCRSLESLTIPASVTTLGLNVFWHCYNLKEVTILGSPTSMFRTFYDCDNLRIIRFCGNAPETLRDIDPTDTVIICFYPANNPTWTDELLNTARLPYNVWFASKDPLSEHPTENDTSGYCGRVAYWAVKDGVLTISGTGDVTYLGWSKFKDQITKVVIQDGITNIISESFDQCVNLTSVTIPKSVTRIGNWAFSGCEKLKSVTLPEHLESIEMYAFHSCTSLTKIALPDRITKIPEHAFANCTSLQTVTFPSGLTEIGGDAFSGCTAIKELHFPATLKVLGDSAFSGCTGLWKIYFYGNVPAVSNFTFRNVNATAYYPPGNLSWISGGMKFHSGFIIEKPDPNQPPQGCLTHDFSQWVVIKQPTPLSLGEEKRICNACGFAETQYLPYVHYDGERPEHSELGEPIASGKGYQIYWSLYADGTLTIFGTRTMEGAYSYPWHQYAKQITRVIVDEGLAKIATRAFAELPNLETVILPSTMMLIEEEAFKSCPKLESIVIPAKVEEIESSAFAFCKSLKTVYFLGNAPKMAQDIFYNDTLTVYYPAGNQTWTKDLLLLDYGGKVSWVAGDPNTYTPLYYRKKET